MAKDRDKNMRVAEYARAMKEGRWRWNGDENIQVDDSGNVLDGRDRLLVLLQRES